MSKSIEEHAKELFEIFPDRIVGKIILGGGCLRSFYDGTEIRDIDCFFLDSVDYQDVVETLQLNCGWAQTESPTRCTNFIAPCGHLVNLVGFVFGSMSEHVGRFDFRCSAHGAIYKPHWPKPSVHSLPGAIGDARARLLYIQNNNGTERTLRRIKHYIEDYGYSLHPDQTIEQEDMFEDAFAIEELQESYAELEDVLDAALSKPVHVEPDYVAQAHRRLAALPVVRYVYDEA